MPIGVQGDRDRRMPEALGEHLDGHPGTQGGGRVAVAELVDGDRWEPCGVGVVPDASQQHVRADRSTELAPCMSGVTPSLLKPFPVSSPTRRVLLTACLSSSALATRGLLTRRPASDRSGWRAFAATNGLRFFTPG